ncbi:hypothetical protein [Leisingera sp. M523]|uniref:hypothetical protein n=1 Tax=Leisingera sp. M523 TaxID=2867013 RepID=UPI0021A92891|nr:hypothetical protein [Leisingera sp. M523]UWQ30205.1 hypothetical protein K3557_06625 [Leisingera sp. M523]
MAAPRVTEAAIQRAIKAAQDTGIPIGAVIVNNLDGTVRIEVQVPESLDEHPKVVPPLAPKKWNKG